MRRKSLGKVADVLGTARSSEERVGAEAIRPSDIIDFTGRRQNGDEGLAELRLRAKPLKNFETVFVREVEIKDYD